jgi:methyl-accepting chemotaxis protein
MIALMGIMAGSAWYQAGQTRDGVALLNTHTAAMRGASGLEQTGHRLGARVSEFLLNPSRPETLQGVFEFRDRFEKDLTRVESLATDDDHLAALRDIGNKFGALWPTFEEIKRLTLETETLTNHTLAGAIGTVTDDLSALVTEANAANNVPARAAARQSKVACLEAYLAAQRCFLSLSTEDFAACMKLVEVARADFAKSSSNAEFGPFAAKFGPIAERFEVFATSFQKIVENRRAVGTLLSDEFTPKRRAVVADVSAFAERVTAEADATGTSVSALATFARGFSVWMGLGVAVVGIGLGLVIARKITRPIKTLVGRMQEIQAEKDLTKRVSMNSRDEVRDIADAFNSLVGTLHDIIAEVRSGTVQIDAGGSQIASTSQSIAQGASQQSGGLQQIAATIEQISGQTKASSENTQRANALSQESRRSAERGRTEMAEMDKAVRETRNSSSEISKIIKVIDGIAFQTNLLALNAAVEAARAGESGKGFAVVAEEVRNLAKRSADAAKTTATLIEESVARSERGVQIADRVGQSLGEITASTGQVSSLLSEIATAASEQATGLATLNEGAGQLETAVQQNAGTSQELASAAEELSSQVASLTELVAQFRVDDRNAESTVRITAKA